VSLALCTMLFSLCLIKFSCKQEQTSPYEIGPRIFVDNKITLSEIADEITYIPLDNIFPIGITYTLRITRDHIYLSIKDVGIVQFDRYGNFVRKVGSRGSGPGEYRYGMEFAIDNLTDNLYVLDPGIVKVYSSSGFFLRDIKTKAYSGGFGFRDIEIYNSLLFLSDNMPNGNSKYNWVFLDTLGKLIAKKDNSVPPFENNFEMNVGIYRFEDKIFYFNYYNDTIFSIYPDLNYKAAYLFAKGEFRWPRAKINFTSDSQLNAELYKLFKPAIMFETKRFIVFAYSYLDKYPIAFIDKKTKKTFLALQYDNSLGSILKYKPFLINNLDGGMPLTENIKYYFENEEEFITTLINPFDLKVYVSSAEFKSIVPKYPEKKKELEKLAATLKETDNPVLVMIRLNK
jgi:hypothetical protein